jgi:hypothetical protein
MVANALSLESTGSHTSAGTTPSSARARGRVFRWRAPNQSRSLRRGTSVEEKRIEDLRAKRRTRRPPRYNGPPPRRPRRRGHCCQRCTTATHIVPASLRTPGPRSMRKRHAGGCLTGDHPEERTLLAWNSDHCGAPPPSTVPRNDPPSPDFRHHNRLPERGKTRPHPSRDRPVSNDAFALEPPPGITPLKNVHCRQLGATSAHRNNAPGLHARERGAQGAVGSPRPGGASRSALPRRSAFKLGSERQALGLPNDRR